MPNVSVRDAVPGDAALILQLVKDLAAYERDPGAVVMTEDMVRSNIFGIGAGGGACVRYAEALIGEVDGVAQGCAVFFHNFSTWTGRPGVYLEDLFVRPEARGAGLGRALLRRVAQIAVERGCRRVDWLVIDWNEPAIGFYTALGARPLSDWTIFRLDEEPLRRLASE
jgi:GNAT superfamily N-acetyltransferase